MNDTAGGGCDALSPQIWIDEQIADTAAFERQGDVHRFAGRRLCREDLRSANVLIVRSVTRVDGSLLEGTPIRFVGTVTTGLDHIDTACLASRGIHLATAAGFNALPVAEYVVASLLLISADRGVPPESLTLGVVGEGRIGSLVSRWAEYAGLQVLRNDPPLAESGIQRDWTPIGKLLKESDIVTLHVPRTHEGRYATQGMVDEARLAGMKRGATLIHTSRGGIVDESALKSAISAGAIGGAVVDTWVNEPAIDVELLSHCRIGTPHIAGHSLEAKHRGSRMILDALSAWFHRSNQGMVVPPPEPNDKSLLGGIPADVRDLPRVCDLERMNAAFRKAMGAGGEGFDAARRLLGGRLEFSAGA